MSHFNHPRNAIPLTSPDGEGWAGAVETGKYMRIQVCVEGDRVTEASFATYGCVPAIAAGSFIAEWAAGRDVGEVERLAAGDLIAALGGLPDGRRFCADLAVEAMQAAVKDAMRKKGEAA